MSLSTIHATSDKGTLSLILHPRNAIDHDHRQHQVLSVTAAAIMPHFTLWRTPLKTLFVRSGWTKKLRLRSSKLQWARARSARCLHRTPSRRTSVLWCWMSLMNLRFAAMSGQAEARRLELGDGKVKGTTQQRHHRHHKSGLLLEEMMLYSRQ